MSGMAVALLLASTAVTSNAGPPPEFWNRLKPITSAKEAGAVRADYTLMMVCSACKTAMIRDSKHMGPPSKGSDQWFTIGSKHQCDHCGGEITVVQGKIADSMEHHCSMCGEGAAFCCAAPVPAPKKES